LLANASAFAQYYSNDVTPAGAAAGKLTGAASGKQVGGGSDNHAYLILSGNALAATDLHPAGYFSSMALSTDDTQQCGYAYSNASFGNHAMLWSGTAASAIDLHSTFTWTYCSGNHNGQQVGFGERPVYFTTTQHAMLWTGSAASAVDLHPIAFAYSKALGVHDGQQVGYGSSIAYPGLTADAPGYHTASHALLWTGSAASVVDLNPAAFTASEASATNGVQQGGWAYDAVLGQHAGMWSGTAASFVDLHPAGYTDSKVNGMTAAKQVGEAWVGPLGLPGSVRHAIVWQGTAASAVDLNQYLPAGYLNGVATGVDAAGNVVGYAYNAPPSGTAIPADAIAVVFAPGVASPYTLNSLTLSGLTPTPLSTLSGTVSIAAPAPANGVTISFLSTDISLLSTPLPVTIPAGQTTAGFSVAVNGGALLVPASVRLYASDGTARKSAALTVTPVVNVASLTLNAVEGGFPTGGTVTLTIPAQTGGATVALTSGSASAVVPATVTVPQGQTQVSFAITTSSVPAPTTVPVTASFNGQSVSAGLSLTQAPVVAVASVSLPPVVGGQSVTGTVTLTNFPRAAAGAVITLTSGDANTLQVPATVTVPYGVFSVSFTATTVVVQGQKGVAVKATYGSSSITTTVSVAPIPTVTIVQADYLIDLQLLKVAATTTFANSVLTYGTDPLSAPIGTMQFELGQFKGSTIMATAPQYATVWNSNGGMATVLVTAKLSSSATGGGGGATGGGGGATGGGGGSTATYKIVVNKNGKGTVTANPSAASYAAGTVVTLTATPDPGFPWVGWGGACSGTATTCSVTMNANLTVIANFK